jgi:replicative DNA helicase
MNEAADMLIYGVMTRKLDIPTVLSSFENDPQLARFFRAYDETIMQYLITNNGVRDVIDFQNSIGEKAFERVQAINSSVILDTPFTPANAVVWAAAVQEDWQRRKGTEILQEALRQMASITPQEALQRALTQLASVSSFINDSGFDGGFRASQEANQLIDDLLDGASFVPTGIPVLDAQVPLELGKLSVLGGVQGCGKTALAAQTAFEAARKGYKVLMIEMEMSTGDLILRESIRKVRVPRMLMQNQRQIKTRVAELQKLIDQGVANPYDMKNLQDEISLKAGKVLTPERIAEMKASNEVVAALPVKYHTRPGLNATQILALANQARAVMGGLDLIVIDHVEFLEPMEKVSEAQKVKEIYRNLKTIVLPEFKETAILVLQHLNTNIFKDKDNVVPNSSDFNYGGAGTMDLGIILIRPWQHKRQLPHLSDDKLDAMTPEQRKKEIQRSFAYPVKGRYVESDTAIELVYDGPYFEWRSA